MDVTGLVTIPARPDPAQCWTGDWGGRTGGREGGGEGGQGGGAGRGSGGGSEEEDRPPKYGQSPPAQGGGRCPG